MMAPFDTKLLTHIPGPSEIHHYDLGTLPAPKANLATRILTWTRARLTRLSSKFFIPVSTGNQAGSVANS
jgi:hypothetical protein